VEAWCALEEATGFQASGKALPSCSCSEAVSWWIQQARKDRCIPAMLDDDDKWEDFYETVVRWWVNMNPGWR
ncbi:hypothetical protein DFH08DRAFT_649063, partial [Mycena albidolilacea]